MSGSYVRDLGIGRIEYSLAVNANLGLPRVIYFIRYRHLNPFLQHVIIHTEVGRWIIYRCENFFILKYKSISNDRCIIVLWISLLWLTNTQKDIIPLV